MSSCHFCLAFQQRLRSVGKQNLLKTDWHTTGHAFANPAGGRYDHDEAALAWAHTHSFMAAYIR
jgi:carboxymethylenebutenolidase